MRHRQKRCADYAVGRRVAVAASDAAGSWAHVCRSMMGPFRTPEGVRESR